MSPEEEVAFYRSRFAQMVIERDGALERQAAAFDRAVLHLKERNDLARRLAEVEAERDAALGWREGTRDAADQARSERDAAIARAEAAEVALVAERARAGTLARSPAGASIGRCRSSWRVAFGASGR